MNNSVAYSQKGFTLVEVMISVAILGFTVFMLIEAIRHGELGARSVSNVQNVNNATSEVRQYLWNTNTCTGNFKGNAVTIGKAIPVTAIKSYDDNMAPSAANVFDINNKTLSKYSTVQVTQASITPIQKVSKTFFVGEVTVTVDTLGQSYGPNIFKRTFPIGISVSSVDGSLVQCGSLDGLPIQDRICDLASAGDSYYDPVTGTCKTKYIQQCYLGNHTTASCPAGWVLAGSGYKACFQMGPDTAAPTIIRSYNGFGAETIIAPPYHFIPDASGTSGTCYWASDLDTTTWICGVNCKQQVVF